MYCTPQCSLGLNKKPYTCPNCKAEKIKPYSTKTHACSKHCHNILTITDRIPINCSTCNKLFYVKPQQQDKVFCSARCRSKYKRRYSQEKSAIEDIRTKNNQMLQKEHISQLEAFIKQLNS
tara:strand:+ start:1340 stop:1702 length:363 start_codon:yes stop_codon:yes gene_type:complete